MLGALMMAGAIGCTSEGQDDPGSSLEIAISPPFESNTTVPDLEASSGVTHPPGDPPASPDAFVYGWEVVEDGGPPEEVVLEAVQLRGVAQGQDEAVMLVVEGVDVTVSTTPGQTAGSVASSVASAINANGELSAAEVDAFVSAARVVVTGAIDSASVSGAGGDDPLAVDAAAPFVPTEFTRKEQTWTLTGSVTLSSGTMLGPSSAQTAIVNAEPMIRSVFVSIRRHCDPAELRLTATDPDGDASLNPAGAPLDSIAPTIDWFVNDQFVETATPTPAPRFQNEVVATLDTSNFVTGDIVRADIAVEDEDGATDTSSRTATVPPPQPPSPFLPACPGDAAAASATSGSAPLPQSSAGSWRVAGPSVDAKRSAAARVRGGSADEGATESPRDPAAPAASGPRQGTAEPPERRTAGGALDVGAFNVCTVSADGALVCSGDPAFGLDEPPPGSFTQVAVAADYACAIRAGDRGIDCWGDPPPELGLLAPPEGAFSRLALGIESACGLRVDEKIVCWGAGFPDAAPPAERFVDVEVHDDYFCAVTAGGRAHCWGS